MAKFKMDNQKCFLVNYNPRKEAEGEDLGARLAGDIKLRAENVPAAVLQALAPVDSREKIGIVEALWNDAGAPRFYGIAGIDLGATFKDAEVKVCGINFKQAKMKDFRIVKVSDKKKADLEFTIQVHPTSAQSGKLDDEQKRHTEVTISPQPELDLEPPEETEGGKKDSKSGKLDLEGGEGKK